MTHGRAMRLLKLIFDVMDAGDARLPYQTLRVPRASFMTSEEAEEIRRTFWISFSLDFHISALTQTAPMLQIDEVSLCDLIILAVQYNVLTNPHRSSHICQ